MSSYQSLAGAYDALTKDVGYRKRAAYLHQLLKKERPAVRKVLDLGCGTGTMTCLLARLGYQMTGVDASEEMLTQAAQKAGELADDQRPLLLHQSMARLRLLEQTDAVVSTLDALNYVTGEKALRETFLRVYACLRPGGTFLFDVNTPYKLRRMDGQVYLDETADTYCVWRTEFSEKTKICTYWVDLFKARTDGGWTRDFEEHRERAWEETELCAMLTAAGFEDVEVTGDLCGRAPRSDEDRVIFHARKPKSTN